MQGRAPNLVFVPIVATAIFALSGCGAFDSPDAQYGGVCVDQVTNQRVDDDRCGDYDDQGFASSPGFFYLWMPTNSGYAVPGVGQQVPRTIGQRNVPSGTPIAKGIPKTGGASMTSIQRGGFGVKSGSTSGVGAKAGSGGGAKGGSAGS